MRPRVAVGVVVVCLGVPNLAGLAAQSSQPQYRSGIDLVTVDVTVLNRAGDPVADLNAADFALTVDGRPRRILSIQHTTNGRADLVPTAAAQPAAPGPPLSASLPRTFVLVVDRDGIRVGEGQPMLAAATRFVDSLAPDDRVALWTTSQSTGSLRFGEDRQELKKQVLLAVGTARPVGSDRWTVGRDEALRAQDDPAVLRAIIDRECTGQVGHVVNDAGGGPQDCRITVTAQARETAMEARSTAERLLANLENLVQALAPLDGPKHIALVTEGMLQYRDSTTRVVALGELAAGARVTIHALQVRDPSYQARADRMRAMPETIDQIQSIEYALAGTTGGLAITPVTGEIAFTRLAHQLSSGYLLVFETEEGDRDGKDHVIDVKVRDRGWGEVVRARKIVRVDLAAAAAAPPPSPPVAPVVPPEPVGTDPLDMAKRLADYVEAFGREITAIVAEERSVQVILPWRGVPSGPEKEPALAWIEPGTQAKSGPTISRRQLVSDVLMVQRAGQQWQSYRDVAEVDGERIGDRESRVQRLFLSGGDRAAFQQIAFESARYNLGNIRRDLNLPTVALSFLRRENHGRFEFKRQKDEAIDGRACRVLAYRERKSPTLISTRNSGDVFLYGRVWLDKEDGRVRRTELRFDRAVSRIESGPLTPGPSTGLGGFRSCIWVDFAPLDGVVTLVPSRMWEWHEGVNQLGRIGGDLTGLQALATYWKYRRFQVTTSETIKK